MYFSCDRDKLAEAVNVVSKAVSTHSTLPVLEGILIEAGVGIKLVGNDLEICIEYNNESDFDIKSCGHIVLNAKMFGDIVRKLPTGTVYIEVNDENSLTNIKCGDTEFDILGISPEDFPKTPDFEHELKFSISQLKLKSMIRQTIFSAAVSEMKPVLTGVLFELDNDVLNTVAVDGYRLAIRTEKVEETNAQTSFVVPGKTLNELLKVLKDENDMNVDIYVAPRHIMFDFDGFKLMSRLLDGEFLNYRKIIAADNNTVAMVDTRPFINSIERAALIINNEFTKCPLHLVLEDERIKINCTTQLAKIQDVIPADIKGNNFEIGFNYKYLLDALRATEDDTVKIEFGTALSACFIRPMDGDEYLYMILPVRLQ